MMVRMSSSYRRSVAAAVFAFVLTLAPYAHAETTGAFGINDPITDTIQLWSSIINSIESVAHEFATALIPHQSQLTDNANPDVSTNNLNQPPVAATAFTAAAGVAVATQSLPESATTSTSVFDPSTNPQQPQSTRPDNIQNQATLSPFVKSAVLPSTISSPSAPETTFVTQSQFNAALSALGASVQQLLAKSDPLPFPEYIAGNGNNANPYAAASNIGNLSNVTITNPSITGLTASEIPDLSGSYLSLGGGTLTGSLTDSGTANSSFAGALGIGTTSPSDVLAVNGPIFLGNVSPTATASRLYSTGGSLYWNGSLIGGGSVGNWATDGTNVWRTGGNVGIGTTTPGSIFSVQGVGNWTTSTSTYYSTGGINITAGCFAVNGTCLSSGGGGTVTSITAGTGLTGGTITTSGTIALDLTHANAWTGLQQFANASTTLFSSYGPAYFGSTATSSFNSSGQLTLAGLANSLLSTNSSGQVVATSSVGVNYLTGTLGISNGGTGTTTFDI